MAYSHTDCVKIICGNLFTDCIESFKNVCDFDLLLGICIKKIISQVPKYVYTKMFIKVFFKIKTTAKINQL